MIEVNRDNRIFLIRPPLVRPPNSNASTLSVPPIGLAYLHGAVSDAGYTASVIDAFGMAFDRTVSHESGLYQTVGLTAEEIADLVPEHAEFIGVSCMFSNEWIYYRRVLQALRSKAPNALICIGGEHASACAEWSMRIESTIDVVVLGEGDQAIVDLLRMLAAGRDLSGVNGIVWRQPKTGELIRNLPRTRIKDIDSISWPKWDSVDLEAYMARGIGMEQMGCRTMPMIASRGCPYQCTFCSNPFMYGTVWAARDPADVIRELKYYVEKYKVDYVEFYDLTTIVKREWILDFAKQLKLANLDVRWTMASGTRSEALDGEVIRAIVESGCTRIYYAPESGSPTTLKRVKKKVHPSKILASMRHAVRSGIYVRANLIAGLPDDTLFDLMHTWLFAMRMAIVGVNDAMCFPFVPYPGSELHERMIAEGKLNPNDSEYEKFLLNNTFNNLGKVRSWSHSLSHNTVVMYSIFTMASFQILQFILRPRRLWSLIRNIYDRTPYTAFEKIIAARYLGQGSGKLYYRPQKG